MPARLVILLNRQLSASLVYMRPSSWQKTRLLSCQAAPAASRSAAWRFLWAWSAATARLGSTSERFDFGVLTSPVRLAERHTWMTALSRST